MPQDGTSHSLRSIRFRLRHGQAGHVASLPGLEDHATGSLGTWHGPLAHAFLGGASRFQPLIESRGESHDRMRVLRAPPDLRVVQNAEHPTSRPPSSITRLSRRPRRPWDVPNAGQSWFATGAKPRMTAGTKTPMRLRPEGLDARARHAADQTLWGRPEAGDGFSWWAVMFTWLPPLPRGIGSIRPKIIRPALVWRTLVTASRTVSPR